MNDLHEPTRPLGEAADEPSGRHPLSVAHLVAGLVFLGIATIWALRAADVLDAGSMEWVFPLLLVVAGTVGLAASFTRAGRR